jgi:hypothetical protein
MLKEIKVMERRKSKVDEIARQSMAWGEPKAPQRRLGAYRTGQG